jgi:hypothetical protein
LVVLALKLLTDIFYSTYWAMCASSGACFDSLMYVINLLFSVSETAFFCFLLVLAHGWHISAARLYNNELRGVMIAGTLLLITLLFFSYYSDGYYFLSLMIIYFLMLPRIISSVNHNMRILHLHLLTLSDYPEQSALLTYKYRFFRVLRFVLVFFFTFVLFSTAFRFFLSNDRDWIITVLDQVASVLLLIVLYNMLLPRRRALFTIYPGIDSVPNWTLDESAVASSNLAAQVEAGAPLDLADVYVFEMPSHALAAAWRRPTEHETEVHAGKTTKSRRKQQQPDNGSSKRSTKTTTMAASTTTAVTTTSAPITSRTFGYATDRLSPNTSPSNSLFVSSLPLLVGIVDRKSKLSNDSSGAFAPQQEAPPDD